MQTARSIYDLSCMTMWKEQEIRHSTGTGGSTLLDQLSQNRMCVPGTHVSAIIDMTEFIVSNELPLRGAIGAVDQSGQVGCGLFPSLFDYTLRIKPELADLFKSAPKHSTYTPHDVHNYIIELMSTIVKEQIVKDVGESCFTIKVDTTKDPIGRENVSLVIRYVDEKYKVQERLMAMLTTDNCDALSLTTLVLDELSSVGLDTKKILTQCYDGFSVMSGSEGGMQRLVQNELNRKVPYVHCFSHQLHSVVVHAISSESVVSDFFDTCTTLYNFLRKPTVAAQYKGEKLNRLLDQQWTGHLDRVSAVLKSHTMLVEFLEELRIGTSADVKLEAFGIHMAVTHPMFKFLACAVYKVLGLMDPPNRMLQTEGTDLRIAVRQVQSSTNCIKRLRSDAEFEKLWADSRLHSCFRIQQQECKRLFIGILDSVLGEMAVRFSRQNSKYVQALHALDPTSKNFLNSRKVKPLLDLTKTQMDESQFINARAFFETKLTGQDQKKVTLGQLVSEYSSFLKSMPVVLTAFKHALTFGASTAMCENSFSTLKNVFYEHRCSILHKRKAHLIQLAFENDLSTKFRDEWKEKLLRRFHSHPREECSSE